MAEYAGELEWNLSDTDTTSRNDSDSDLGHQHRIGPDTTECQVEHIEAEIDRR